MPFGNSKSSLCSECGIEFPHLKKLSEHIKKIHNLSPIDYCIKHMYNNVKPSCKVCDGPTRYVSIGDGFKNYCAEHRKFAEREGGKIGGKIKSQWNKGITKETDPRLMMMSQKLTGEGNPFFGKKHTLETIELISNTKKAHHNEVMIESKQQLEVVDYVKSIEKEQIEISTKNVIPSLEIDVWIPSKNIAIVYHNLYWQGGSQSAIFDRKRHRDYYQLCKAAGIKLIQIYSDEWANRNDVVKSIISNALGVNLVKLNARDCTVEVSSTKETKPFLEVSHMSGSTRASYHYVLKHKVHGIVGAITLRRPIQKKWGDNLIELARMAFKQGVTVRGGASKLLTRAIVDHSETFDGMLSYAELRFSEGGIYAHCGFERKDDATMNYWYTDGIRRFDRFKFRAQPGKPEKIVADEAGVRPVYGCGNAIYLKKFC
jgi:hypothetical protein